MKWPIYILMMAIALLPFSAVHGQDYKEGLERAMNYYNAEKYDSAAMEYEIALLRIKKNNIEADFNYYIECLINAAFSNDRIGSFDKGELYLLESKTLLEEKGETFSKSYLLTLYYLSGIYAFTDRYKESETILITQEDIIESYYKDDDELRLKVFNRFGLLYYEMGDFKKALIYLEKCDSIYSKGIIINPKTQCILLTNIGSIYSTLGRYEQSLLFIERSRLIYKENFGKNTVNYITMTNNLATTLVLMGNYEKAEQLFLETLIINSQHPNEQNINLSRYYNNLGFLYLKMGRYEQAENYFLKAYETDSTNLGLIHTQTATRLNNLAEVYYMLNRFKLADSTLTISLEIFKNQFGENHHEYANSLGNLAMVKKKQGELEQANSMMNTALKIERGIYGDFHPSVSKAMNNLAIIYDAQKQYDTAEFLYNKVLEIDLAVVNNSHPDYLLHLHNLLLLYEKTLRTELAFDLARQLFLKYQYQIKVNTGFLTQVEFEQFFKLFQNRLEVYLSMNITNPFSSYGDFAFDMELMSKGIGLQSTIAIKNRILESGDTALINRYFELRLIRKEVVKLLTLSPEKRTKDPASLEKQANELEKSINSKSKDFQQAQIKNDLTWIDIYKPLKSGEIAIEFTAFKYYYYSKLTDSTLYCAIILNHNDITPYFVYLCEEKQLKGALPDSTANIKEIDRCYKDPALYNLLWKPIDSLLQGQGINTVYFAPSGLLNSVAMAAIRCPDGKLLSERYNLVQLSSTRTIAMPEEPASITDAVIYGGIKFDPDTTAWLASTGKYKKEESVELAYIPPTFRGATRGGWAYLPGTKKEARLVAEKLARNDIDTTTFAGVNALEESFYSLSGNNSPSIIHISTHGFYYPDTVSDEYRKNMINSASGDIQFKYADDPLLRSGLILAGGNNTWKGLPRPEGIEDGILTAREVSNMNLLNTELVVLSACQTGQGDVKGSEGVEGLQRGFKMAGVHYLIMSLWEVPDKETTEFMDHFYSLWPGGELSIRSAFRETQLRMMRKYPGEPSKWAGFVLME